MRTLSPLLIALSLAACRSPGSGEPAPPGPAASSEPAQEQQDAAPTDLELGSAPEPARAPSPGATAQEAQAQREVVQPTRIGPNVPERPPTWYAVQHLPGPSWRADVSPFEQPAINEHIEHYAALHAQGKLALGGPFMDAGQGGGLMVLYNVTYEEAVAIAETDPAVQGGTLLPEVRTWFIAMSGE